MQFREYGDLTREIHAPERLKMEVLEAARASEKPQKAQKPGRYSRGFSFVQKAAVAAVLLLAIPLTAYAATKAMGLKDYLEKRGFKDLQVVDSLTNTFATEGPEAAEPGAKKDDSEVKPQSSVKNDYAEYTVLEAVCDQNMLYLRAQIKPVSDKYFLMPGDWGSNDDVGYLNIEGVSGCSIGEYAKSQGKTLVSVSVGYWYGEDFLAGSYESQYQPDGTILFYHSAQNIAEGKEFTLRCTGSAVSNDMTINEHTEFEITVTDNSTSQQTELGSEFDPKIKEELGLTMVSLDAEDTEMATYFNFTWKDGSWEGYNFEVVDAKGNELPHLPDQIGTGILDNGDGTFSEKLFYQKVGSLEGLRFRIKSWEHGGDWFGPYELPK